MNIAILSISVYVIFSLLFMIIKHFVIDKSAIETNQPYEENTQWMYAYVLLSFFVIAIQNIYFIGETECSVQYGQLFIHSIMPLFLVMGLIIIFLVNMNWNRIFANTFGMMLAPKIVLSSNQKNPNVSFFYNDPNILLQELEPNDLLSRTALNYKLGKLLNETIEITEQQHQIIKRQYFVKQNVGYFIWLTFAGIVTSLISANSLLLQDCIIE
jgi:hypothetical protein